MNDHTKDSKKSPYTSSDYLEVEFSISQAFPICLKVIF
jgi:hypothetical protein